MANLNKVMLIGRLTEDPELKFVSSGTARATFRLATNRFYKDASGEKQEEATFVPIVCWAGLAENVAKYQKKGKQIYVEGRLRLYHIDGDDGVRKYYTEVVAEKVEFLDKFDETSDNSSARPVVGNVPYTGSDEVPF